MSVPPELTNWPAAEVDYLARDYQSLRRLLFDRLTALLPGWRESHPADITHALVEAMAYVGDQLSYYQDAVATEAYLGTARRRISVARHARLVDYHMHEGCNARVWVQIEVSKPVDIPAGTPLLSDAGGGRPTVLSAAEGGAARTAGALAFETMHAATLDPALNELPLGAALAPGATSALLGAAAGLAAGQALVIAARTAGRLDLARRHPVRLVDVQPGQETGWTRVFWSRADALPFGLDADTGVALGNIVLADHGRSVDATDLNPPRVPGAGIYRPRLGHAHLTFAEPYDHVRARSLPAAQATIQDPRAAQGVVTGVTAYDRNDHPIGEPWRVRPALLTSDRFARVFVVEVESDRQALLRFGDGVQGVPPPPGALLRATYRVGGGRDGNAGPGAIAHLVSDDPALRVAVRGVHNPLPAVGGVEPEPIEQVRLSAPYAFQRQARCVTEEDYAAVAESHPAVQKAAVTMRWTGSWYTAQVVVDLHGGRPLDDALRDELLARFAPYRLAGYDIAIRTPEPAPLDIALEVALAPGSFAGSVRQTLLAVLGEGVLPGGRPGFFAPDNFTLGQPVYLGQVLTQVMQVPGVAWANATIFRRLGSSGDDALRSGRIDIGRFEVARLRNNPNDPAGGRLNLTFIDRGAGRLDSLQGAR